MIIGNRIMGTFNLKLLYVILLVERDKGSNIKLQCHFWYHQFIF
jgi:hypothetical protein